MALSAAILHTLRRSPEKVFTASDIAGLLKLTDYRDHGAIRTQLSRMARHGRVTRVSFGKYKAG